MPTAHDQFIAASVHFLRWNLERIATCLATLTEAQVWLRPNEHSNSIGNQLLHLNGNVTQWLLNGIGGQRDVRKRDAEFAATGGTDKATLFSQLANTIKQGVQVLEVSSPDTLLPERPVQAYVHDGHYIILHVVEHLSYHTGQIIFYTKLLVDRDLHLYGTEDLNRTN